MAVYFYGCITMDGYLADSQHRIDWLHQLGSVEDTGYDDFYRQMDITIMGKRPLRKSKIARCRTFLSSYGKLCLYA